MAVRKEAIPAAMATKRLNSSFCISPPTSNVGTDAASNLHGSLGANLWQGRVSLWQWCSVLPNAIHGGEEKGSDSQAHEDGSARADRHRDQRPRQRARYVVQESS